MKELLFQFTGLELLLFCATILSMFFNLFQLMVWWRDKKNLQRPLYNTLLALFNDIKTKGLNIFATRALLWSPNSPHKDIQTLKWEYHNFLQVINAFVFGFQETVVGLLVSVNPKDREGQEAFRASEYGLTETDKVFREKELKRLQSQQPQSDILKDTSKDESAPVR